MDPLQTRTPFSETIKEIQTEKEKPLQTGLYIIVFLSVFVVIAIILVVVFVFCYRKRLKEKSPNDSKSPKEMTLHDVDTLGASSTLIPSDLVTPNPTDANVRTFNYPTPRRRLSSTGSTNSTTPLLRYRTGSYRSRFSSGVSSRIDSNIAEGKRKGIDGPLGRILKLHEFVFGSNYPYRNFFVRRNHFPDF